VESGRGFVNNIVRALKQICFDSPQNGRGLRARHSPLGNGHSSLAAERRHWVNLRRAPRRYPAGNEHRHGGEAGIFEQLAEGEFKSFNRVISQRSVVSGSVRLVEGSRFHIGGWPFNVRGSRCDVRRSCIQSFKELRREHHDAFYKSS
jgi:hypothetical protein